MKTLLIIEDNRDILENTCEILELSGFKTLAASNGKIGFEKARQHIPDLILCDIMMPESDGYEVLTNLKSDPLTDRIPFVFLTASVERKDVQAGFDLGACGYIRKPFDTEELLKVIEECLNA